jgi:cytochrome c-550 PedF
MPLHRIPPASLLAALLAAIFASPVAVGHGDVTPQVIDTSELTPLGEHWRTENPYRSNATAIEIGKSGYNQNCARCHGLEVVSGGIAPDLRRLPVDAETDEYFAESVRRGKSRNGAIYMPPFEGILSQEAIWAIRAYVETRHVDD